MHNVNRRDLLRIAGFASILATGGRLSPMATARPLVSDGSGTTLDAVATPLGDHGYQRLGPGPGWPTIIRSDLAEPLPSREDRRVPLASVVQLTDVHIIDAQSPARFEYLHPINGSAFRPQETLTVQGLIALVHRINALRAGPHGGRAFDAVISTGDNCDNMEIAELEWFLTALNGGRIAPDTGLPNVYEGVQKFSSNQYWNPDDPIFDLYKQAGFPTVPGLLEAAIKPVDSPGLTTPWYSVFGNHDNSVSGVAPFGIPPLQAMYTGNLKYVSPASPTARAVSAAIDTDPAAIVAALSAATVPPRLVTADPARRPLSPREYIAAHLDPAHTGPGPLGHGFAPDAGETGIGYYSFEIAPQVVGISLDTANRAGLVDGSLGEAQFRWVEGLLRAGSSKFYDSAGYLTTEPKTDTYFLIFSHHTSATMDNLAPDPERPQELRYSGAQLIELLRRFPNVLGWVNGHTHMNKITPWPGPTPEQGFWEINTASHIDFPQLGRIIEITDNRDGTVSLFSTLFEAMSPYSVDYDDHSPLGLASLYRELSYNDIHRSADLAGAPPDRNVELVVKVLR
ncbi:TIGR03767 family metallophosphoesterase [Nocardia sp. NPDC006044]|uniref:TIGR03767 family metallophosphoesterase n=1 Tax=Nocardia sp. NPDC006044 TaxID=3364306 RepID=UPI0036923980